MESWSERALHPLDLDQELLLLILFIEVKGRLKIKPSKFLPKTVSSRAAWLSRKAPAPTQKRAVDSLVALALRQTPERGGLTGGLPRTGEPGDLLCPHRLPLLAFVHAAR